MLSIQSRSWDSIIEFYAGLVEESHLPFESMLNLVRQITTSPYILHPRVTILFPATSHEILLIAAVEPFVWATEMLQIQYIAKIQSFQFDFFESPYIKQHWKRTSSISNGFSTFERFLHLKRWG